MQEFLILKPKFYSIVIQKEIKITSWKYHAI